MVGPCFCWGFWQKRVVGCGVLVVKLWWIAGESWEVDGQDSGSKNMPLFPDLFLRDSHFGNFGLEDRSQDRQGHRHQPRRRDQRVHGHQPVWQDHPHRHQIHPCCRSQHPRASRSSTLETQDDVAASVVIPTEEIIRRPGDLSWCEEVFGAYFLGLPDKPAATTGRRLSSCQQRQQPYRKQAY